MNSWSRVKEFQDAYNKGWTIGSAQRENEIYLDSIAGKWNTLRETMTKSISTVGVRDAIKDILDMATKAVEAVNNISNAFGKFGTLGIGVGIASFVKQMASFSSINWSTFSVVPNMVSTVIRSFSLLSGAFETIKVLGFGDGIKMLGLQFKELVASSGLAKTALVGLKAVLTGIGWGIAIAGVVALGKALYDNAHATEQFVAQSKEQQDVIRDNMTTMSSTKSSLSEIASEYDKLASKTNKTAEELQRFSELKKQIAEISPDLVAGYDSAGDPILKLNGSLTNYIGDLDVAIQKQQQLYNQKTAEQAYAYASENDKNKNNSVANKYNSAKSNVDNQIKETVGLRKNMFKEITGLGIKSAKEMADAGIKYEKEFNDKVIARRKELAETSAKYQEQNLAMQSSALTKLAKNEDAMLALKNSKATDSFQKMMTTMDWGSFNTTQLSSMERGMQKLATVSKGTVDGMGEVANKTKEANNAFKENHNVEKWGQALQQCAKTSGSFDTTSWGNYLAEVNAQYEEGAISAEQYNQYLTHMAQTIADLTNTDMDTVLQSLTGSGDAEARLDALSSGLNNFLSAYNKTATDIRNGDSMAIALEKQFNSLKDFGSELRTQVSMTGEVDVDWLINQKEDLPQQMQTMIEAVTADNKVTEVEQELLMTCEMQIENQGKLNDDLANQLQGIFDGTIDISNGVEIAGIKFNAEEAQQLKEALAGCADEAGNLNIKDLGIDKMANDAKKLEAVMKSIGSKKLRLEFEKQGIKDNVNEVNSLKEALKSIPEKKQLDFVAECGSAFNNVNSLEEGIKNIPDSKKLKFDIGVDGNEKLEDARAKLEGMPEEIRTLVYNDVIGVENLDMVEGLLSKVDGKTATAILSIDGIQEVFNQAESVEDFLEILTTEEWETKISANCENADEIIKTLEEALEELTGDDKEVTVKTKKEEETVKKEKKEKEEKTTKKETIETEAKTEGVEEAKKQVDDLKHSLEQGIHGEMTLEFKGEDKVEAVIKDKERLEVEGKAITDVQLNNGEKYSVAINEKGQLEVNGVAQTDIDISGAEKLTIAQNEKGQLEVNGQAVTNLDVTGTEKLREANEYVKLLETDAHGNVTITVNGKEEIFATVNEKGKLEADGRALTYVQIDGGEKYAIAVNEKGQLEVNGKALTDIDISGAEKLSLTKNEKGELEVNGQAVTDVMVHGAEKAKTAKKDVEELQKTDGKKVSVNIDISLKETVGEILSRLGLNKKTEKVELKVTCTDEATPKINKILQNNNKPVTFKMNADSANVDNTVKKVRDLGASPISIKLNCNADQVTTVIQNIRSVSSKPFTFSVTAPGASEAYNSISKIQNIQASPKSFTVTAPGSSDAYNAVLRIKNCTIGNKRFTVTAPGSRDAYNAVVKIKNTNIPNKRFTITAPGSAGVISALSTIKSKLDSIHGKAVRVSVTTVYKTVGKPSKEAGGSSANEPEIIKLAKPSFGSGATTQALSGTAQALSGEIQAINNNAETLNNAVSTANNSAELMASKKIKPNIDTSKTIDALKHNVDLLTNMSNLLSKLATQIDTLKAKQQRTWGSATTKLLKEQISLLTKQQSLTKVNIKNIEGMSKKLKSSLKKQGFKFKDDGSISNYNSKLIAMEKNVEKLKKKEESYKGKSEKTKDKLSKAYEKANDQLQQTKNKLSEYYDLQFSELPNAKKQWEEYANAIAEAKAEIIKADREARTFFENMREDIVNARIDRDTTNIEILELKADLSSWSQAVGYIEQANELLIKNQKAQTTIMNNAKSRLADNKAVLDKYGFNYTKNGWLTQPEKTLEKLRKTQTPAEYEAIKEAYDEYVEDMYRTIPEAEKEWWSLQQAIEENKKKIEETNRAIKEMVDEASVSVLVDKFDSISRSLDLLEVKMEGAFGVNKRPYMEDQIELLNQMQTANKNIIAQNEKLMSQAKDTLWNKYHILFDDDGNITNLAQRLEVLNDLEDMEVLQDLADRYTEYKNAIDDATISIEEEKNQIQKLKDSMLELEQEMKELRDQAWIKEFENGIKLVQNKIDKLDSELNISGSNQVELLNEKIKTYEKLAIATEDSLAYQEKRKGELSKTLISYGFEINDDGTINDTANKLEALKNTLSDVEFEIVSDTLEGYFEVALDTIPELEKTLLDYQKELQDIQKTKLEKTQRIEDEITKIYEKQIEERKKLIEEEAETQVKVLNKAKDAYNRYRDEVDYRDDYDKQLKTVEDLQRKLEIAKRDDSLTGQKRVEDLQKQLLEEQKNLEKLVQDKIDNDINNMFDDQIDKIQTDADEEVKKLEDTWTESKIAEAVQQALDTGIFTSIDGEIKSLNTALIEFANTSSDYFGVMGAVLKSELIDNLKVAYSTMDEIQKIYNDLNVSDFSDVNSLPNVNIQGSATGTPINNNTITIGDTNITVEGSADSQTVEEIELMLKDYQQKIYADIMKNVK